MKSAISQNNTRRLALCPRPLIVLCAFRTTHTFEEELVLIYFNYPARSSLLLNVVGSLQLLRQMKDNYLYLILHSLFSLIQLWVLSSVGQLPVTSRFLRDFGLISRTLQYPQTKHELCHRCLNQMLFHITVVQCQDEGFGGSSALGARTTSPPFSNIF